MTPIEELAAMSDDPDTPERKIRDRAYAIWEREGFPEGRHEDHWHQASREIAGEGQPAETAPQDTAPTDPAGSDTVAAATGEPASLAPAASTPAAPEAAAARKPVRKPRAVKPKKV
ncbi:DUF2934 domain-containing protein [uncultured Sphingomonas sp.]|uniref:DUF2934 domain-containing protein n=1 Tax=uncultured Sphingomonas sp. TaxID=158754 RepID=UPI0025F936E0|nr:DUF2934 domain-containing protein [uncultured Sphingomonas sp.]